MNHNTRERTEPTTDPGRPPLLMAHKSSQVRPLLRVYTLGPLTLEWVGTATPFPAERLVSRGAAPALLLLKALISRPHRYGARDWLCEHLHSAEEDALSPGRLDDLASLLRGLLCPPIEDRESRDRLRRELLTYVHSASESGPGYRLGSYPLIWTDIDALSWSVEQACRMERFGEDALPLWERAYALAKRGAYLIDEPYSDWAETRRAEAGRYLRQSVHALARLYLSQPDARAEEEALRVLGDYWQQHIEDEDALRPLMELLGKHERYQEALSYYERLCEVLSEEGKTPDARTTDLKEFLRTKQLQRSHVPQKGKSAGNGRSLSELPQTDLLPLFSQAVTQGILGAITQPGGTHSSNVAAISQSRGQNMDELRRKLLRRFLELAGMSTLPLTLQGFTSQYTRSPSIAIEEFIPQSSATVRTAWQLMNGKELAAAETILAACTPVLLNLALEPSGYQQAVASVATQASMLRVLLAKHRLNYVARELHCHETVQCSRLSGDHILQSAALVYLGFTYIVCPPLRPAQAIQTFQQVLATLGNEDALVKSDAYLGIAEAYSLLKEAQQAQEALQLAQDSYPAHPERDPSYQYLDYPVDLLYQWEAKVYLNLGYYQRALDVLDVCLKMQSSLRGMSETLIHRADAALGLGNQELYFTSLKEGTQLAFVLDSQHRYQAALKVYQKMPEQWRNDQKGEELIPLFSPQN